MSAAREACGVGDPPAPGGLDNDAQVLVARRPAELRLDLLALSVEHGRIAVAPRRAQPPNRTPRDVPDCLHDLAHRTRMPVAKVVGGRRAAALKALERADVRVGQV